MSFKPSDSSSSADDPATAPPQGEDPVSPDGQYQKVWHFDVRHKQQNSDPQKTAAQEIDTRITLWKSKNPSGNTWVVEKRLFEMPGNLAALTVHEEKHIIKTLMEMGLPCAELAPWRDTLGGNDPYALFTRYVGPSPEELFRHRLVDDEYAATMAAHINALVPYRDARVLLTDAGARQYGIALSETRMGQILFKQCKPLDHAHDVIAEGAANRRWPYLGLKMEAAPELVALLEKDTHLSMSTPIPGCPATSWAAMKQLPPNERTHWMLQLKSPNLGGALENGELNIDAALQSLLAFSWKELLVSNLVPSRRLHPNAVAFLEKRRRLLDKMNHPDPLQRYESLEAAAAAWLDGKDMPETSTTRIVLLTPGTEPVEGASMPDTLLPHSGGFDGFFKWEEAGSPDQGQDFDGNGQGWGPQSWPDNRLSEATATASVIWSSTPRLRLLTYTVVTCAALVWLLATGLVREPTPQLLRQADELEQLDRIELMLKRPGAPEQKQAVKSLMQLQASAASESVRQRAKEVLDEQWAAVINQVPLAIDGRHIRSLDQRKKTLDTVRAWATIGYPKASEWQTEFK